jgi:hypothetical protein
MAPMGESATKAPPENPKEQVYIPEADLKEYGFQLTTNQDQKMVWLRPLIVWDADEVKGITHDQVLEALEVKAVSILERVINHRQRLRDLLLKTEAAKDAGVKPS